MATKRPAVDARLVSSFVQSLEDDGTCKSGPKWRLVGQGDAHFGRDAWHKAVEQLILHPEYSSSSILRADIEQDVVEPGGHDSYQKLKGSELVRYIRRLLLPRRPNLDRSLVQDCFIYDAENSATAILQLKCTSKQEVPYYHPLVRSLALKYVEEVDRHVVELHLLLFEEDVYYDPVSLPQHRLSRTVLSLIELLCKTAWGFENGYEKRVEHDVLVPKTDYQTLYMRLRNTYAKQLIDNWAESTDPSKHVFEDLGIAAFIMLLWRDTFPSLDNSDTWGRPEVFVDVGCGNGLLVYLLTCEGYTGYGIDVQQRKSWQVYSTLNGKVDLRNGTIDPVSISLGEQSSSLPVKSFLIGNHADELTSWIPLLADRLECCSGFINIPCCRFQLDGTTFGETRYAIKDDDLKELVGYDDELYRQTILQIDRGPPADKDTRSRNIAYLRYIDHLQLQCGWQLEKEALRIPSTKNWAIIGRRRIWSSMNEDKAEQLRTSTQSRVIEMATLYGRSWQARCSPSSSTKQVH